MCLCAGEYRLGVKYNDEHVPKSPRMVQVDPQCEDAKRVTIHGLRDRGLEVSRLSFWVVCCQIAINNIAMDRTHLTYENI